MSYYVNFDKYPYWLSWRVLDRERLEEGWLTEPVIFFIGHNIHYKTMFFLFNSVL